MSSSSKDKQLRMQEKYQAVLSTLLREEDNKYCADCEAKGPRWTSWNLGVFICIRCAGIHRNLGVHISKVKSVNLDQWTAEQIASMLAMGNSRAKAIYECNLGENYRRSQSDSAMEQFIRAKYEQRKWIDKSWSPAPITIPPNLIDDEKDKRSKQQGLGEIKFKKENSNNNHSNTNSATTTAAKKSSSSSSTSGVKNELDSKEKKPPKPVEEPVLLDFDDLSSTPSATKAVQNNVAVGEDLFDNENFKKMNLNEPPQTVEITTTIASTPAPTLNADIGELTLIGEDLNSKKALGSNLTGPIDKDSILALYKNNNNFASTTTTTTTNKPLPTQQINQFNPNTNNFNFPTSTIPTTMTSPNIAAAAQQQQQQQLFSQSMFNNNNNSLPNSHSLFNISPQINNNPSNMFGSSNQTMKPPAFNQFNFAPTNNNNNMNSNNLMFPMSSANKPPMQQPPTSMTNNNMLDFNFGPFTTSTATSNTALGGGASNSNSNTLPNIGNTLVSDLWN